MGKMLATAALAKYVSRLKFPRVLILYFRSCLVEVLIEFDTKTTGDWTNKYICQICSELYNFLFNSFFSLNDRE